MTNTGTTQSAPEPIYVSLAGRLRRDIREGRYAPGELLGSEHALAKRESISRMTVRRASESLVQEGLLERRPGKGLYVRDAGRTTRTVRVVAGNLQWEPALQASRGIQRVGVARGIETQLYDAHGDVETDLAMLRGLPETSADGAIVVSLHSKAFNETIYDLKRRAFPFVLVDQKLADIDIPSVTADNYSGGCQAARHLLDHGHVRLGFVGDLVANTVRERLAGFRDAIADAGLPLDRSRLIDLCERGEQDRLTDWSDTVDRCTRELMQRPDPPTAVFFSCDAIARASCRTLREMGLRVPDDVSVVGFDDDPLCQWMDPKLTSVRQPFFQMGEAAIEMLCEVMANPDRQYQSRVMPVTLVKRDTVAKLPDRR